LNSLVLNVWFCSSSYDRILHEWHTHNIEYIVFIQYYPYWWYNINSCLVYSQSQLDGNSEISKTIKQVVVYPSDRLVSINSHTLRSAHTMQCVAATGGLDVPWFLSLGHFRHIFLPNFEIDVNSRVMEENSTLPSINFSFVAETSHNYQLICAATTKFCQFCRCDFHKKSSWLDLVVATKFRPKKYLIIIIIIIITVLRHYINLNAFTI